MNKNQLLALTSVTTALTAFITTLANEDTQADTPAAPAAGEAPKTRKPRGTPPATVTPPAEPETPVAPVGGNIARPEPEKPVTGGQTYEELQLLIEPIVKSGQGGNVKAAIAKHKPADWPEGTIFNLTELAKLPQHHAAFAADIEALSY